MIKFGNVIISNADVDGNCSVQVDITAPLYWWAELDRYISVKVVPSIINPVDHMFTLDDFSHEHLCDGVLSDVKLKSGVWVFCKDITALRCLIADLNVSRNIFLETGDIRFWWKIKQSLPSSYNITQTIQLSDNTLEKISKMPEGLEIDEWDQFRALGDYLLLEVLIKKGDKKND